MNKELEEYKFDHFKNIDEVMHYFNYWYKEEDVYSINRYLSLKDFNYISNKYQELQKENKQLKIQISAREEVCNRLENNWNKLKEYIDKTKFKEFEKSYGKRYGKIFIQAEVIVCNMILDKMHELEQGSDSNE